MTGVLVSQIPPELPGQLPGLAAAGTTHTGLVRPVNEDVFLCLPGLYAVFDGMGGHAAGDVASGLAASVVERELLHGRCGHDDVVAALQSANVLIRSQAVEAYERAMMGCTATGLLLADGATPHWWVFNIGDSRVYLWNGTDLEQLTTDHSEVQEMVNRHEISRREARSHPRRHVVTRSLGVAALAQPDVWQLPVVPGARFLLCSDGLVDELDDDDLAALLSAAGTPDETAARLVAAALEHGGRDNVTCVVVDVLRDASDPVDESTVPRPERGGA